MGVQFRQLNRRTFHKQVYQKKKKKLILYFIYYHTYTVYTVYVSRWTLIIL
jgi:hypothetical protein